MKRLNLRMFSTKTFFVVWNVGNGDFLTHDFSVIFHFSTSNRQDLALYFGGKLRSHISPLGKLRPKALTNPIGHHLPPGHAVFITNLRPQALTDPVVCPDHGVLILDYSSLSPGIGATIPVVLYPWRPRGLDSISSAPGSVSGSS